MSDCSCCNSAPKARKRGGEQEGNILSYSLSSEEGRKRGTREKLLKHLFMKCF